ncbi:MAG: cell division protein SepF [Ruminococcus sp.]|uniref:cell division protein SepF n=1 Tax=Ruminococcus sp. TaxID=41978 RepID=UPI0028731F65|nr:cell division protein SepF [Ruminococcus sp.]MBQ3284977.1 cell division protein SepF [Ruminococcus sp.]
MAGFVDKFKRMWDAPDDEMDYNDYDDYDTDIDDRNEDSRSSRRSSRDSSRYDDFDDPVSSRDSSRRNKVVNISATAKLSVALFKPERFGEETRNIADELIKTHTVVLNLENTNKDMARRIIDFLSGVAYANRGKIKKVATSTFIIIPNNVDLTGDDLLDELEHSGVYF